MGKLKIKVIYCIDNEGNRLTVFIVCGNCYVFDNFLTDYEMDIQFDNICNFLLDEKRCLTEENFRNLNVHIENEVEIETMMVIQ